jgi:hypothetical protein
MRRSGNSSRRLLPRLGLLIIALTLGACGKPKRITAEEADHWEPVTFAQEELWSQRERDSVSSGFNSSDGAFYWSVWFYEGKKGIDVRFFPRSIASHIVYGKIFQGFSNMNTIGISDLWDDSPTTIESLSRHEIDHWLGRVHKSELEIRQLESRGSLVTDSMTWKPWPPTTKFELKKKPQPDK